MVVLFSRFTPSATVDAHAANPMLTGKELENIPEQQTASKPQPSISDR
jgi:hypothetical protein